MLATRRDADREHALEEDHPLRSQSAAALLQFAENGCKLRDPEVPSFGRKHENRGPTTSAQTVSKTISHFKTFVQYPI